MINRILCPVDFSDATAFALTPAISLATEFGSELILLHVLDHPTPHLGPVVTDVDLEDYYEAIEARAIEQLEALVDDDVRSFAKVRTLVRRGAAFREIVRVSQQERPDLIVMPTHARTGINHMIWGSVAEKVVRLAPCPVMTISPRQSHPQVFGGRRVLFATDFSKGSERALETAVSFARHYKTELVVVHVVTTRDYDPANPDWRFPPLPAEHVHELEARARENLERLLRSVPHADVEVRTRLISGFEPGLEIAGVADDEVADLVVMSTHGRTGLGHLVIGSTAETAVRYTRCPVMTVKQESAAVPLDD